MEYFSTMAQLSGVILGFANLANAIYRPNVQTKDLQLNQVRILMSTEMGLLIIVICIIPILFQSLPIPQASVIKVTSFILMFSVPSYMFMGTTRTLKLMGKRFPVPVASKLFAYAALICGALGGLNAFEILGADNVFFIYQLIVFIGFLVQSFLFLRLIRWILSNHEVASKN